MKKRGKNKAAIATVVGGLLILVVLFSTIALFLAFDLSSRTSLEQTSNQRSQQDQMANVEVFNVASVKNSTTGYIFANVTNLGPNAIQLVSIIVGNVNTNNTLKINTAVGLPVGLNSGSSKLINTTYPYSSGLLWIKAVTALGTIGVGLYPVYPPKLPPMLSAIAAGAFGDLLLHFYSYAILGIKSCTPPNTTVFASVCLNKIGAAFTVPHTTLGLSPVAFSVQVTNVNPLQKTIVLDSSTLVMQFWPQGSSIQSIGWFILSNQSSYIFNNYNSNRIVIPYNDTVTLVFGNSNCAGKGACLPSALFAAQSLTGGNLPPTNQTSALFIFAHGWKGIPTSDVQNFGQNMPFVYSLYL